MANPKVEDSNSWKTAIVVFAHDDGRAALKTDDGTLLSFGLDRVAGYDGRTVKEFGLRKGVKLSVQVSEGHANLVKVIG